MKTLRQTLGDLLVPGEAPPDRPLPDVIVADSRKVTPGALFVAIRGVHHDGHDHIGRALAAGAEIIVYEKAIPTLPGAEFFRVTDAAAAFSLLMREKCGAPDETLDIVGVTGTNGKTSTVYCVRHFLEAARRPCGLISTIAIFDGKTTVPASGTTPGAATLFPLLETMKKNALGVAAMEFSSHALDQKRAAGIRVRVAIFTNLTGDHLDYHRDMDAYFAAKKRLFFDSLAPDGTAVISVDDPRGRELAASLRGIRETVTFGADDPAAQWKIAADGFDFRGSRFSLISGKTQLHISTPLVGMHNIRNLTGAILAARALGVPDATLVAAAARPVVIPGRLERYDLPSGATAFVDYAHTDDALANVLGILREIGKGKLAVVFGAGGDRDITKRPRMGCVAARFADELYITSDNPRSEDPQTILDEIVSGIPAGRAFRRIADRRAAIEEAVKNAHRNDIVLVAGKGHENYQEINGVRRFFSDAAVLTSLGGKA
ncbi:MAG: UDP-N-acetylmuramoyl-L-alanyl-D-glutamate--2,6-diaminopimelate ligase [Victivallaceae bacterium]|nr:UDP-N-acetylmuramoyl-L-alanyl-D-glutamate--2,6-diaminopimelate ligase [Victivallaceae bacterium]